MQTKKRELQRERVVPDAGWRPEQLIGDRNGFK